MYDLKNSAIFLCVVVVSLAVAIPVQNDAIVPDDLMTHAGGNGVQPLQEEDGIVMEETKPKIGKALKKSGPGDELIIINTPFEGVKGMAGVAPYPATAENIKAGQEPSAKLLAEASYRPSKGVACIGTECMVLKHMSKQKALAQAHTPVACVGEECMIVQHSRKQALALASEETHQNEAAKSKTKEEPKKKESPKKQEEPKKKEEPKTEAKQAEPKKEQKEEGQEEEEAPVTTDSSLDSRNVWAFIAIIGFLVLFTIIFEEVKETIEEVTKGTDDHPLVMTIFTELTVLGFLALVTFIIGKCGLSHLSLMVYGHDDVDEDKAKLGEVLEQIHMVLFLIMVLFIALAIGIIIQSRAKARKWNENEGLIVTHEQRSNLVEQYRKMRKPTFWESLTGAAVKAQEGIDQAEFESAWIERGMKSMSYSEIHQLVDLMLSRQSFLHAGNGDLCQSYKDMEHKVLDPSFSMSLYLRKSMAHQMAEVVELPKEQWAFLLVNCAVVLGIMLAVGDHWEFVLWFWMGLGWFLVGVCMAFIAYLENVKEQLSFDLAPEKNNLLDNRSERRQMSMAKKKEQLELEYLPVKSTTASPNISSTPAPAVGSGSGNGAEETKPLVKSEHHPHGKIYRANWISGVPRYLENNGFDGLGGNDRFPDGTSLSKEGKLEQDPGAADDRIKPSWSIVPQCMKGEAECEKTNKPATKVPHQVKADGKGHLAKTKGGYNHGHALLYNLFAFGRHEVHFHLYFLRAVFLGVSVYLSIFCIQIAPHYLFVAYDIEYALIITFFIVLPGMLVYFRMMFEAVTLSVMTTSVAAFRKERLVGDVKRHQKEQRAVFALKISTAISNDLEKTHKEQKEGNKIQRKMTSLAEMDGPVRDELKERWMDNMQKETSSLEIEEMMEFFDSLDVDGNFELSWHELKAMLYRFDLHQEDEKSIQRTGTLEEKMAYIQQSIREVGEQVAVVVAEMYGSPGKKFEHDDNEVITRLEFMNWIIKKNVEASKLTAEQITETMFKRFNTDDDFDSEIQLSITEVQECLMTCLGGISEHKKKQWKGVDESILKALAQRDPEKIFSYAEVSQLILELDVNDDGEFSEEEFEKWIEKHSTPVPTSNSFGPTCLKKYCCCFACCCKE